MRRLMLIAAMGAVLASLGLSPTASAAPIEYESASDTATSGTLKRVAVECPGGYLATGGAAVSSGGYSASYVSGLGPVDGSDDGSVLGDSWAAYMDTFANVTVTSTVACVKGKAAKGLKYVMRARPFTAGQRKTITARCPKGYLVTGGGPVNDVNYLNIEVLGSHPINNGSAWRADLSNFGALNLNLRVYAICAKGKFAKGLVYREKTETAPAGAQALAGSSCPQGTSAVGGGVKFDDVSANLNSTGITASGDGSQSYVDGPAGETATFTNYAVCSK